MIPGNREDWKKRYVYEQMKYAGTSLTYEDVNKILDPSLDWDYFNNSSSSPYAQNIKRVWETVLTADPAQEFEMGSAETLVSAKDLQPIFSKLTTGAVIHLIADQINLKLSDSQLRQRMRLLLEEL